jgi:putative acetyltransferase
MSALKGVVVRPETPSDYDAVRRVNVEAFGQPLEADIVDVLRANGNAIVSLVAELEGAVVGHALFSPFYIDTPSGTMTSIALGPLAVLPSHQNQGVGSALMLAGIDACRSLGYGHIFLLGHRTYYPRFGFTPARHRGIIYQDGRDSFMVLELVPGALDEVSGMGRFSPEFAVGERPWPAPQA